MLAGWQWWWWTRGVYKSGDVSPPIVMTSLPSGNEHSDFLHSLTKLAILNARLFICLPTRSFPHQTQKQQQ